MTFLLGELYKSYSKLAPFHNSDMCCLDVTNLLGYHLRIPLQVLEASQSAS